MTLQLPRELKFAPLKSLGYAAVNGVRWPLYGILERERFRGRELFRDCFQLDPDELPEGPRRSGGATSPHHPEG